MALIECSECHKEISDKAVACPHCGSPTAPSVAPKQSEPPNTSVTGNARTSKKTSSITWIVLAFVVAVSLWYFPKAMRDANLPLVPVEVKTRAAITGPGLVLLVKNTSNRHLTLLISLKNPTTSQERSYRLDLAPSGTGEIGHREGWPLASGDQLRVSNNDYKDWEGNVP